MRHGSHLDPPNRFETIHVEIDDDQVEWDEEYLRQREGVKVEYLSDDSQSIVTENQSPDISFRYSINPYRGCVHACSYCYARPYHEYLGWNAGRDFETKILVKPEAPRQFREFLTRPAWKPELIVFSGVTDCYQPIERSLQLTRKCLAVAKEANQPIGIVTKNALVARDLDYLSSMAKSGLASVAISITTLEPTLARAMEPRTSIPAARIRAIQELSDAGVPTKVMVSPIIPGLNDSEVPAILKKAKQAGARSASYILIRLPLTVEPVFIEWLERTQPERKERVLNRIRECRDGRLSDSEFGRRQSGQGVLAEQIGQMFKVFARQLELDQPLPSVNCDLFRAPTQTDGQLRLF